MQTPQINLRFPSSLNYSPSSKDVYFKCYYASARVQLGGRHDTFIVYTMFGFVGTPKVCRVGSLSQSVHLSVEDLCYDL